MKHKNDKPSTAKKDAEKHSPASSRAEQETAKPEKPKEEKKKARPVKKAEPKPEESKENKPKAIKQPDSLPIEKAPHEPEDKIRKTSLRWSDGMMIHMEVHSHLLSTASVARAYAEHGYPDRYIIISECTDLLKNPRGFKKSGNMGLRVSIILRPSIFPSQAAILAPLAATALAENLSGYTTKPIGVGWISTVYCDGKAIGGITIETKLDNFLTYEYIILTFDAQLSAVDFPPKMSDLIRQVFEPGSMSSSATVMTVSLMQHFFPLYSQIKTPAPIIERYRHLFLLRGKKGKIMRDGKWVSCKIIDIDKQTAGLIVQIKDEEPRLLTAVTGLKLPAKI